MASFALQTAASADGDGATMTLTDGPEKGVVLSVTITGTTTNPPCVVIVEGAVDVVGPWTAISAVKLGENTASTPVFINGITVSGSYDVRTSGWLYLRGRIAAYTSGVVTASANEYLGDGGGPTSGQFPASLGQKAMAASFAVVIASDQSAIPVTNTVLSVVGGGTEAPAQRVTIATDSTGLLSVDDNGSSLTVDAVNLDIRDLTFAVDKVDASGSSVSVSNAAGGSAVNIQDGGNVITVDGTVAITAAALPLPAGAATSALQLPDGHNVTVDNAAGAAAVNIQDGGNTITVDGTVMTAVSSIQDAGNSTSTLLGIGGVFMGVGFDLTPYASWSISIFSNVASAASGLRIEWSENNINWDFADITTYIAAVGNMITFGHKAKYVRLSYTNGGTGQATFRVTAWGHPIFTRQTRKFVGAQLTDADSGQVVVAAIQGHTTAGGGAWVDLKVNPSGSVEVGGVSTVGTITPGTAATNLGKAEDVAHASGDVGVLALAVRNDNAATDTTSDDRDNSAIAVDIKGAVFNRPRPAVTPTLSNVAGNAASVTLLASNAARRCAMMFNDSTASCYVKFGVTASATDYVVKMGPASYFEAPAELYGTGRIDGIWTSGTGSMRVTEVV